MEQMPSEFEQFHWMVDMVQNVDIGLIVLDRDFHIHLWNGFMTHHSGKVAEEVLGRSFFDIFPEIDLDWFKSKTKPSFELACRSFLIWRQRPYLFKCRNVRPVTQQADFMYQNITINPMLSTSGGVNYIFLSIQDVTTEVLAEKSKEQQKL